MFDCSTQAAAAAQAKQEAEAAAAKAEVEASAAKVAAKAAAAGPAKELSLEEQVVLEHASFPQLVWSLSFSTEPLPHSTHSLLHAHAEIATRESINQSRPCALQAG